MVRILQSTFAFSIFSLIMGLFLLAMVEAFSDPRSGYIAAATPNAFVTNGLAFQGS